MSSSSENVQKLLQEEALARHVVRFSDHGFFSPSTVSAGLEKIHGSHSTAKGTIIAGFNSNHVGCPFFSAEFKPDEKTGFAKYLHLGTTRIWKTDGSIDEERWNKFVTAVTVGQESQEIKTVSRSALKNYLQFCYENDPQESTTGRNTNSWFSSGYVQATAATQAWEEVFDRLTCGWVFNEKLHEQEPFINLDMVRLFFADSTAAFQKAEDRELPVSKPGLAETVKMS